MLEGESTDGVIYFDDCTDTVYEDYGIPKAEEMVVLFQLPGRLWCTDTNGVEVQLSSRQRTISNSYCCRLFCLVFACVV